MQANLESSLVESIDGPLQAGEAVRKVVAVDLVVTRSARPGFLTEQDHGEAAPPCQSQGLIKLRFVKVGQEQIGSLDRR